MKPRALAAALAAGVLLATTSAACAQTATAPASEALCDDASAAPACTPQHLTHDTEADQLLREENQALRQALQARGAALEQQLQLMQAVRQLLAKTVQELSASRQAGLQLQAQLDDLQQNLQQAQQRNLEQGLAMADERQHAKAVHDQNVWLQQQNQRLLQRLALLKPQSGELTQDVESGMAASLLSRELGGMPHAQMLP